VNGTSEEMSPAGVPSSGAALDDAALSGPGTYRHGAAVVDSDEALLDVLLPFVDDGLAAGDLTVVSCTPETRERVHGRLGTRVRGLELYVGLSLQGARPPDAFVHARQYAHRAAKGGSGRLRVFAEVAVGHDVPWQREQMRFEAAANQVMSELPVTSLCLYDARRLPPAVLESAGQTHPELITAAGWAPSSGYCRPRDFVRSLPQPRDPLEDAPPVLTVDDASSLPEFRHRLVGALADVVPDEEQLEDLRLAVSEMAANAFRHGRQPVSGVLWAHDHWLVCTVTDSGTSFDDPLAGFIPAHGFDLGRGGMGLWLARKLFDHVDLLPGPGGFTVRLSTTLR